MSAPSLGEWFEELSDLHRDLESMGQGDTVYGTCCVSDPRNFHPDPECSTEAERAAHKADCDRVEAGGVKQTQTSCMHIGNEQASVRIQPSGYGLGTNTIPGDPDAADFAERLQRVIRQIEMWREEYLTDEQRES